MGVLARQQIQKPNVSEFLQPTGTHNILGGTVLGCYIFTFLTADIIYFYYVVKTAWQTSERAPSTMVIGSIERY